MFFCQSHAGACDWQYLASIDGYPGTPKDLPNSATLLRCVLEVRRLFHCVFCRFRRIYIGWCLVSTAWIPSTAVPRFGAQTGVSDFAIQIKGLCPSGHKSTRAER